ncbi:uncharacterized protein EURHEDRAFT_97240 [Aspergillus ruber CBS 135680]|uniref:Uncharacterized protein n=1 Tax=Aspergillus ruber (strain CBS 135680) TaxID=1388766 RepID=A0A017SC15_ASPRC|nr:uncharacterized protein EURHEDRAFT_97240 [Aspergillus ruber CBS 135680]EYE94174.1 hypothetical protein EURHEDRAFT_97240 [Aspergillus ruber CBS 135680]
MRIYGASLSAQYRGHKLVGLWGMLLACLACVGVAGCACYIKEVFYRMGDRWITDRIYRARRTYVYRAI